MSAARLAPLVALVAVTAVWGSTFVLVKDAIRTLPPLEFLAIRFTIGAVLLAVLWGRSVRRVHVVPGLVIGVALAVAYALQTFGLEGTTATKAAFITGLFVVFTPVVVGIVERRAPRVSALVGVVLATVGLGLLTLTDGLSSFGRGDVLVLGCAFAFAVHITAVGHWAPTTDVRSLAVVQLAVAAAAFVVVAPLGGLGAPRGSDVWVALGVTAVGATAFAFAVQTWAQSRLPPTRTAVILTLEPVFGGVFGYLLAGEVLTAQSWVGAAVILGAMLTTELGAARRVQLADRHPSR